MTPRSRIFVAGHRGLAGSAILRRLEADGFENLLTATRRELDLRDGIAVEAWFEANRPEYVFLAAGTVGGILANVTRPVEFLLDNLRIHSAVVPAAHRTGVRQLLYLGSSCVYPRDCPQPIREEYLLTGPLEPTNAPYALAKIAGIELCRAYRRQYGSRFFSVMPANLYGPGDNFDLRDAHVFPALLRKFHEAQAGERPSVVVWGTGAPRREFLHADDLAEACVFLMQHDDLEEHVNVGTGEDVTIRELAELIRGTVAPGTEIVFDAEKPDGTPRKVLDVSRIHALGWKHRIPLAEGIRRTYAWFLEHASEVRKEQVGS